jgi:MFS family permease
MGGFACATIGSLALAAGAAFGGYLLPVACGGIFVAAGFTVALVVVMGAATAEVPAPQQGTASGIAIMTQNIGSSIGVAIALGILSASSLNGRPPSLASYQVSYLIMAAMTASGFLVTWLAIRRGERLETTPVSG